MKNLELKFRCNNFSDALKSLKKISAEYNGILKQTDVYFNIKPGRLKLRTVNKDLHQLIFYKRANIKGSKLSNYYIENIVHPQRVKNILGEVCGIKTIVVKNRKLYLYKNCRVHLDSVKGLGKFIEFEVVCSGKKEEKNAPRLMDFMKREFKVTPAKLIKHSYSDLMTGKKGE